MPKAPLKPEFASLERQVIETMIAGHHIWRPDLNYPESHSDMQGCARGLLMMFEVKRRPLALALADIQVDPPVCVICGERSMIDWGGVQVCGNAHAREFAQRMLDGNPDRSQEAVA
jgi:hypothetical protein